MDPECQKEVRGTSGREAPEGRPGGRPGLPCHTSEQLKQDPSQPSSGRGGKSQRLARLRVEIEIQGMVTRWGAERIGFLTFTFADDVQTIAEAQRRYNSLNSRALAGRYREWVSVVQRHKDNRIHFHLVVVMAEDIRTGFDFDAVKGRDYSSASRYLRDEWAFLRGVMPDYQFGRHELLPIKNPEGFGRYVARYVTRGLVTRADEKGARLVRFSKGFNRVVCGPFSKVDLIEKRSRDRLPWVMHVLGYATVERMEWDLGHAWRYKLCRLLYCTDHTLGVISRRIMDTRQLYGGNAFIIEDEFKRYDAEVATERAYVVSRVANVRKEREADALDLRPSWGFRVSLPSGSPPEAEPKDSLICA